MTPAAILLDRAVAVGQRQVVVSGDLTSPKWRFAKMCAGAADWNAHELGSHLTLAHIVSEVACVVTYSSLPHQHPIYQLLLPHFFRTLPLNDNARTSLVPEIIAQRLSAFSKDQCFAFCAAVFNNWNFEDHYVPNDLQARGVADLPLHVYPYATTARLVWDQVRKYVAQVVNGLEALAPQKQLLANDFYLGQWCTKMQASTPGFPNITDTEQLCDALTMIIYTATHQHSAVNYFQSKYLSYVPAAPGFLATRPPSNLDGITEADLLAALPRARSAELSRAIANMLSDPPAEIHRLTQFQFSSSPPRHYVEWTALRTALQEFQQDLQDVLRPYDAVTVVSNSNLAQSVLI